MRLRSVWNAVTFVIVVSAVLCSVLLQRAGEMLVVGVVVGSLVGLVAWTVADGLQRPAVRAGLGGLLWGSVAGVAAQGWIVVLGGWGWLIVMPSVLTFPDLVQEGLGAWRSRRTVVAGSLQLLSDAEPRRRWQESGYRLHHPSCRDSLVEVVEQRARILDEVEARGSAELSRWIRKESRWGRSG